MVLAGLVIFAVTVYISVIAACFGLAAVTWIWTAICGLRGDVASEESCLKRPEKIKSTIKSLGLYSSISVIIVIFISMTLVA